MRNDIIALGFNDPVVQTFGGGVCDQPGQIVPGADPVKQALLLGGHQLAVPGQQAVGPQVGDRVVERARSL